jgi:cation diffusion facilitator family transporter
MSDGGSPAEGRASAPGLKQRTATLSVASNSTLILLKIIAGTLTGSVAILTEAVHSSIDLVASVVAFLSVRKAGEPADESHRYGHEKIENLAAAIEGILILVGSAAIAFQAIRHLLQHGKVHSVGLGIAVVAGSMAVNLIVSTVISRGAQATDSPALAGDATHLRTDALSSGAVLIALVLVSLTGAQWLDPAIALAVAGVIVVSGVRLLSRSSRVLVDEALPAEEVDAIREAIEEFGPRGVVGYHELRTRRAGSRRYVDLHVQFRSGTSLEDAHRTAHELQDRIASRLRSADVLIHLEPEDRVRPGERLPPEAPRPGSSEAGAPGSGSAGHPGAGDGGAGQPEVSPGRGSTSRPPVDRTRRSTG